MDSHDANDPFNNGPASNRWLAIYKYYLIAAVALSAIGIATFIFNSFGRFEYLLREPSGLFEHFFWPLILGIAQIGLFLFAIKSLDRIGETWVRTLHLSINGVAVAMGLFYYLSAVGVGDIDSIWSFWFTRTLLQICGKTVLPISALIPWGILWSNYPHAGGEQHTVMLIIRLAITTVAFVPAVFWCIRWNESHDLVPVQLGTENEKKAQVEATSPTSIGSWLITLILISIPLLNIILLLWWSFSGQTPINKANFAKACLIFFAISTLLYLFVIFAFMSLFRGY